MKKFNESLSPGHVFEDSSKPLDSDNFPTDQLKEHPEKIVDPVQPTFSTKEDHANFNSWYYEQVGTKSAQSADSQESSAKSKVLNASSPTTTSTSKLPIPVAEPMKDELFFTDSQDMYKEITEKERIEQNTLSSEPSKKFQGSEILLYLQAMFVLLISIYRNEYLDPKLSFPVSPYQSPAQCPTPSKQPRSVAMYENPPQPCACQKVVRTLSTFTLVVTSLSAALSEAIQWGRGRVSDLKENLKHAIVSIVLGDGWEAMRVNEVKTHEELV